MTGASDASVRLSSVLGSRLLCAILAVALSGCAAELPDKGRIELPAGQPVRVGVVTELDGPLAGEGAAIANSVMLAAAEIGTLRGRPLEVVLRGGGCDPAQAASTVDDLARDPLLLGIIGPICSPACVAAIGAVDQRAVALISPRCTDVAVTRQAYGGIFRTVWNDGAHAIGAVEFVDDELDLDRAFIVHDGTIYGRNMRDLFKQFFGKDRLAGTEEALVGSEDYGPAVRAIAKSSAQIVFYAGFAEDAARFMTQLRAAGVTIPVIAPDTLRNEAFVTLAGDAAEGTYVVEAIAERAPRYAEFAAAYRSRFGTEPGPYAGEAYDALYVLVEAADAAARRRGERLVIDRRDFLREIVTTDMKGVTGRIRFRLIGDRIEGVSVRVLRVERGRFVEQQIIEFED
jgi:branched-chain amino acid transport system substrate-binding protein